MENEECGCGCGGELTFTEKVAWGAIGVSCALIIFFGIWALATGKLNK